MNLISGSKCHNILWRHYTYVETYSKFIRAIFCNVTLYYCKLEVCHHKGVRNMFERRVLLAEELNGKLRTVILRMGEYV